MRVDCGRTSWSAGSVLRALASAAVIGGLLFGCGNNQFTYGTAVITFSATPGPFSAYVVGIQEITLTRNDGVVVYPVGLSGGSSVEQIADFTQLNDHTEMFGAPAVPEGTYTSATVFLDYSAAQIWLPVNGTNTRLGAYDSVGNALTTLSYTVNFDKSAPLVIKEGTTTPLDVNFDLNASTSLVNLAASTIVNRPFVSLNTAPVYNKPMRQRGLFVTAKATQPNTFVINARPFNDIVSFTPYGSVTVAVSDSTVYAINGTNYTGSAGLAAMQDLQINTNVAVLGTLTNLNAVTPTVAATQVLVGFSSDDELEDRVTGVVAERNGDSIVLRGAGVFTRPGGATTIGLALFEDHLTMTVGKGTVVTQDNSGATLTADAISVGQRINVGANLNDANGNLVANSGLVPATLDATEGFLRLTTTPVWGTVNSATAGSASLNALELGGFPPSPYLDLAGTGQAGMDASAAAYAVNTAAAGSGASALAAAPAGTLALLYGNVTPFGAAPPDFNATSATVGTALEQQLVIDWVNGGSKAPYSLLTSTGLAVKLNDANLGTSHVVVTGPVSVNVLDAGGTSISIVPDAKQPGAFALGGPTTNMGVYNSFATFAAGIGEVLNSGGAFQKLVALGRYDAATQTFTAHRVDVVRE
jgi:hypothetical protein